MVSPQLSPAGQAYALNTACSCADEGDYRNDYPEGEDDYDSDELDDEGDRPSWSD